MTEVSKTELITLSHLNGNRAFKMQASTNFSLPLLVKVTPRPIKNALSISNISGLTDEINKICIPKFTEKDIFSMIYN